MCILYESNLEDRSGFAEAMFCNMFYSYSFIFNYSFIFKLLEGPTTK